MMKKTKKSLLFSTTLPPLKNNNNSSSSKSTNDLISHAANNYDNTQYNTLPHTTTRRTAFTSTTSSTTRHHGDDDGDGDDGGMTGSGVSHNNNNTMTTTMTMSPPPPPPPANITVSHHSFLTDYIYQIEDITFPLKLLFDDFLYTKPLKAIHLKDWILSEEVFYHLARSCTSTTLMNFDFCQNITINSFRHLLRHPSLRRLSLQGLQGNSSSSGNNGNSSGGNSGNSGNSGGNNGNSGGNNGKSGGNSGNRMIISREIMEVIGSLPNLITLNLSQNIMMKDIFNILSTSCKVLKSLNISKCEGIDDLVLYALGQCIERYHQLERINLSYCLDFTDEGFLSLLGAGQSLLREINCQACQQLTNLSLVGFRGKMNNLKILNLSQWHIEISLFDYLVESSKMFIELDLSHNPQLQDTALILIGKYCKYLENINFSDCNGITDEGWLKYFSYYQPRTLSLQQLQLQQQQQQQQQSGKVSSSHYNRPIEEQEGEGEGEDDENGGAGGEGEGRRLKGNNNNKKKKKSKTSGNGSGNSGNGSGNSGNGVYPLCLLKKVNVSNCAQLGDGIVNGLANYCPDLVEVNLDGLSRVRPNALQALLSQCRELRHFSMSSLLSTLATHRRSTMPHLTDHVILSSWGAQGTTTLPLPLERLEISGACQLTDKGIEIIMKYCYNSLQYLNLSYIPGITDKTLITIAKYLNSQLHTINLAGCIHISDIGLMTLTTGRYKASLQSFSINGCNKLTNKGIKSLIVFKQLTYLSMRSVDLITDYCMIEIFKKLHYLISVDLTGCDLLSIKTVEVLFQFNRNLEYVRLEKCNISTFEFCQQRIDFQTMLPFVRPQKSHLTLILRPSSIRVYNRYVNTINDILPAVNILQRLARYIYRTRWHRIIRENKKQAILLKQKIFQAWYSYLQSNYRSIRQKKMLHAVYIIQSFFIRCYISDQAKRKLQRLKLESYSSLCIQTHFRGYRIRKRFMKRYQKYKQYKEKWYNLVNQYYIIYYSRLLRKKYLIHLQAFIRMIPYQQRYQRYLKGLIKLQKKMKLLYRVKCHQELQLRQQEELRIQRLIFENKQAIILQRNLRAGLWNRLMSKFILICCIYYRNEYDDQQYYSSIIQRYYRGYYCRLLLKRQQDYQSKSYTASCRIQGWYRMISCYQKFQPIYQKHRKIREKQRLFLLKSRPRLRLGQIVKKIQKCYRLYLFRLARYYASIIIQRVYRGYHGRLQWKQLVIDLYHHYACRIQRIIRKWIAKKNRQMLAARQHMAAYRIYLMVNKPFEIKRKQKQKQEEAKQNYEIAQNTKALLVQKRREFFVSKIKDAYLNSQVMKIQRCYHSYCQRKLIKEKQALLERGESSSWSESAKSITTTTTRLTKLRMRLAQGLALPGRILNHQVNFVKQLIKPQELITEGEDKKLTNAVLNYQVRSILQEGLIDIVMTIGEVETKAFDSQQRQCKNSHLPYFIQLKEDLSGILQMDVYLWLQYGSGMNCICQLEVHRRPLHTSTSAMKVREQALAMEKHIKLIWHPKLPFEIHAERSILQGKASFAIQNLTITTKLEDMEKMQLPEARMSLVADLSIVGIPGVNLWCTQRQPPMNNTIYRYHRLNVYDWFDERLERTMKSFTLSEDDVFTIYQTVFQRIINGRNRNTIRIEEIFYYLNHINNEVSRWAVLAIEPLHSKEVTFSEYLHFVCYFVMLSAKDLGRFLFQQADTEHKHYLRRDEFCALMQILATESPFNARIWEVQYETFHDHKLHHQFIRNFLDFMASNPGILWQPQKLQHRLQETHLGKAYWSKKMEQYRVTRAELGIKLM